MNVIARSERITRYPRLRQDRTRPIAKRPAVQAAGERWRRAALRPSRVGLLLLAWSLQLGRPYYEAGGIGHEQRDEKQTLNAHQARGSGADV